MHHRRDSPPSGRPSCTSPGLLVITSPACASTMPQPLIERCPPRAMKPMPNVACQWRPYCRVLSVQVAKTPGHGDAITEQRCCAAASVPAIPLRIEGLYGAHSILAPDTRGLVRSRDSAQEKADRARDLQTAGAGRLDR